jgi:hypothetical protein
MVEGVREALMNGRAERWFVERKGMLQECNVDMGQRKVSGVACHQRQSYFSGPPRWRSG